MNLSNKPFTEIFRAKSLDNLVLPVRVLNDLAGGIEPQNIMLYGPQGTSKTTIARILIDGFETLHLNGSSENGIDTIRNKVCDFASHMSLFNGCEKIKVIFIDEADGLTDQAWDALRETIEHYATSVRFICTCNRIDKIPAPIQSRFKRIAVYPITKEEEDYSFNGYCDYVSQILSHFKIGYTDETLRAFVKNSFPDMRSILNSIQSLYVQGAAELNKDYLVKTFECSDLFEVMVNGGDPIENYKFITTNYSSMPDEALKEISRSFVDYIRVNYPEHGGAIPYIIITIAEYMSQLNTAPDRMLLLLACVYKVQVFIKQSQQ